MFGSRSDVVGTKSGLALNRQQLGELLGRDERFREFQELRDGDWVRIESVTAEEMIKFLLFSVGRLERINTIHCHLHTGIINTKEIQPSCRSSTLSRRHSLTFWMRRWQIRI